MILTILGSYSVSLGLSHVYMEIHMGYTFIWHPPANLSYISLIIRPTKETRRKEGEIFSLTYSPESISPSPYWVINLNYEITGWDVIGGMKKWREIEQHLTKPWGSIDQSGLAAKQGTETAKYYMNTVSTEVILRQTEIGFEKAQQKGKTKKKKQKKPPVNKISHSFKRESFSMYWSLMVVQGQKLWISRNDKCIHWPFLTCLFCSMLSSIF